MRLVVNLMLVIP